MMLSGFFQQLSSTESLKEKNLFFFLFFSILNKSYLKVNSVTLSGDGLSSASAHNWDVKLNNVKINHSNYFNSDNNFVPTIAMLNYDENNL